MEIVLVIILVVTTFIGYKIVGNVPSLLHTPLMSGMNAFSGLTVLSCIVATATVAVEHVMVAKIMGYIAIILATINVFCGFSVTERMLKLFHKSERNLQK